MLWQARLTVLKCTAEVPSFSVACHQRFATGEFNNHQRQIFTRLRLRAIEHHVPLSVRLIPTTILPSPVTDSSYSRDQVAANDQADHDTSMAPASPLSPTTNMNADEPRQEQDEGRGAGQRQPTKPHARPRLDLSTAPKERKRGKSMFGLVLGTLNKAKIEDKERNASDAVRVVSPLRFQDVCTDALVLWIGEEAATN